MPLFNALGGTINAKSLELQKEVDQGTSADDQIVIVSSPLTPLVNPKNCFLTAISNLQ
jgi:hypothetical protein